MARPFQSSLVDASGAPLRMRAATQDAAHAAAARYSPELANWHPSLRSADAEWLPERNTVAARVHDVARNNGWASGAMQRFVDQAIGADFRLSYRPDWMALGLTLSWARGFAREVEARFRLWANDPRCLCDAGERSMLSGLIGLGFRHRMVDGEAVILPQWIPGRANGYATCLQVIDPDRLSTPDGMIDDETLRGGVEINAYGAPQAYHFRAAHPGDAFSFGGDVMRWVRIPRATKWGRQRVLHFFEPERAGQTRGKSILTPILERMMMEHKYSRYEMQAAAANAVFAAVIESPFDTSMVEEGMQIGPYQELRSAFHNDPQRRISLSDGVRMPHLFPGEKLNFQTAQRPNSNFSDFERAFLRYFAAATGQAAEQVGQDWSQTNYSSARAALLEAWKFLTARRGHFANGVATPIFGLWLEEAIDKGDVKLPNGAPDFWTAFPAWVRCRWIGPGRGWVDPVKEAQAAQIRKDTLLSTDQDEAAEQGRDIEEIYEQQAHERALRQEYGLPETKAAGVIDEADPDANDEKENQQSGARALVRRGS